MAETTVRAKNFHDLRQEAIKAGAPAVVDDVLRAASAHAPHLDSSGDGKDQRELEASFYVNPLVVKNEKDEAVQTGEFLSFGVTVSVVAPSKKR